jgi:hypothetical protein
MALHKANGGRIDLPKFAGGGDLSVSEQLAQDVGVPQDTSDKEPSPYPFVAYQKSTVPYFPGPDKPGVQSLDPISVHMQKPSFLQNLGENILGAADLGKTLVGGTLGMVPAALETGARMFTSPNTAQDIYEQALSHYTPDLMTQRGKEMGEDLAGFMQDYKIPLALPELMAFEGALGPGAGAALRKSNQALKALEPEAGTLGSNLGSLKTKKGTTDIPNDLFEGLKGKDIDRAIKAFESSQNGTGVPRTAAIVRLATKGEDDIASSMMNNPAYKKVGVIPQSDIDNALAFRTKYRQEAQTTPGPMASEEEWANWGKQHGVNMTRTPDVSMGITDPTTGREIKFPGGLEGKFTIPDLYHIKANNIDPNSLPKEMHDALMQKFIRTHNIENPDEVDIFNRLNFALLSPNAPLTPNEFLAQRARITNKNELMQLAAMKDDPDINSKLAERMGTGAASVGGMGTSGTADLSNQAELAHLILTKPEMFKAAPGETLRDVTLRVMNQVPGLGPKTASLGTPWLDLPKANTSAVDLHMIRNSYERMLNDPEVGEAFRDRMAGLLKTDPTVKAIMSQPESKREEAAIKIIGGTESMRKYRMKSTGELNKIPDVATPEKLAYEPEVFRDFGPFYKKVVDYIDESRGTNPALELFPEQWRLWDRYRGRVEPHEFAHPDYKLLPKQSWTEMQDALKEHKASGYTQSGTKIMKPSDWRKMFVSEAEPQSDLTQRANYG